MVFHLKACLLTWMDTVEQEVSADPMEAAIHLENQVRAFKKAPWNETYSKSGQDVGTSSSSHSNNCLQPAQQSHAMKWKRQISKGALKTSKTLSAAFLLHNADGRTGYTLGKLWTLSNASSSSQELAEQIGFEQILGPMVLIYCSAATILTYL